MMRSDRERFEIRIVDAERRVYRYLQSDRRYFDACLIADAARLEHPSVDFVVLDAHEGHRVLYDSRKLRAKVG